MHNFVRLDTIITLSPLSLTYPLTLFKYLSGWTFRSILFMFCVSIFFQLCQKDSNSYSILFNIQTQNQHTSHGMSEKSIVQVIVNIIKKFNSVSFSNCPDYSNTSECYSNKIHKPCHSFLQLFKNFQIAVCEFLLGPIALTVTVSNRSLRLPVISYCLWGTACYH